MCQRTTLAPVFNLKVFIHETSSSSLRVVLLMTDGTDHPRSPSVVSAAAEAKQHNIQVFTISLLTLTRDGPVSTKLRSIASAPPQHHVLSLSDSQLDDRLLSEMVRLTFSTLVHVCTFSSP